MTDQDIPFSRVQPLVSSAEQAGDRLHCTFTCAVSNKSATTTVNIVEANAATVGTKVRSRLRSGAIRSVTRTVTRSLRSIFGSGVVGRLANELADDKAKQVAATGGYSPVELERAKVAAFAKVQSQFAWSPEHAAYVHSSAMKKAPAEPASDPQ